MKLTVIIFICTVCVTFGDNSLNETLINSKWKNLMLELTNTDLLLKNHLIQYVEHYKKISADENRGSANYLGCFKDHRTVRMFRGYCIEPNNAILTPDWCKTKCRERRFSYAGLQAG